MDQSPDVREEKKFIQVSEGIKKMVLNGCKVLIGDLYVINVMPKVCKFRRFSKFHEFQF